jgi:hypothetical protein
MSKQEKNKKVKNFLEKLNKRSTEAKDKSNVLSFKFL